jgi:hypothetical protein
MRWTTFDRLVRSFEAMKVIRFSLILVCLVSSIAGQCQQRQWLPLYASGGAHHMRGWFVAPGVTYMLPTRFNFTNKISESAEGALAATYDPGGRFAPYLGVGRFHLLENMIFPQRFEYGLAYKRLSGFENMTLRVLDVDNNVMGESGSTNSFKDNFLVAHAAMSQYMRVGQNSYFIHTLGLNFDWMFIGKREAAFGSPGVSDTAPFLVFQGFYRLGYGYKLESGVFLEPSIETPILNILPFESGRSTLGYFSSRYRPLIFTLRFYWQDKRQAADCVGAGGKPSDNSLWDPKMKKSKKSKRKKKSSQKS